MKCLKRSLRKLGFAAALAIFLSAGLPAEFRVDLGIDVPRGVGAFIPEGNVDAGITEALSRYFIPFPEVSAYFEVVLFKSLALGVGARGFTFILESVLWPNAFIEYRLGPFIAEIQAGGGLFAVAGLANATKTGAVFFPDFSVWFAIKSFRVGTGFFGVYSDELPDNTLPYVWYLGAKFTLEYFPLGIGEKKR